MKLWHSLTTCLMLLLLLDAAHGSPPLHTRTTRSTVGTRRARATEESPLEVPPVRVHLSVKSPGSSGSVGRRRSMGDAEQWEEELEVGEKYIMEESLSDDYEDVVDLIKVTISRIHHSPTSSDASTRTRHRRAKKGGSRRSSSQPRRGTPGKRVRGGQGRGHGCVLKQVQLNVTDLGLGYRSGEEMIFRYCAGPCRKSETNYDKILSNLVHNKRLPPKDRPAQACCRPVAFDDDLSFLDDNLVYHTVRKHSARKCACV